MDIQKHYNLPDNVRFCKTCAVTNQRPRLVFDDEGNCSVCHYQKRKHKEVDWQRRQDTLQRLLDRHRRNDGRFDVVVPFSGGKDSCAVAHKLKYTYGMNPLTVTFAPYIYTEVGWQNIQNAIHSGLHNITITADGLIHRRLTAVAFEQMGDPFLPFIYGQQVAPLEIAANYEIPLVMYGENGAVEYEGSEEFENESGYIPIKHSVKMYCSGFEQSYWKKFGFSDKDLHLYQLPDMSKLERIGIETHFFSYFEKWLPQENFYYAAEHCGFQANPDGRSEGTYSKYASLDDKIDGFHFYLGYIKFGHGRAMSDAVHEVRDGHITREEAVALINRYNGEFPAKYFKDFLEYINMDEERFQEIIDSFRSPHLWEKKDGTWRLKVECS